MNNKELTRYEKARVLGARALQIAMNAPLLIKMSKEDLEKVRYDAIKIAEIELNSDVLPISIHKPFPQKIEAELKKAKVKKVSDQEKEEMEDKEEEEIIKSGEIMSLANPDDESEEEDSGDEELE